MAISQDYLDDLENIIKKTNLAFITNNKDEILSMVKSDENLVRLFYILGEVKKSNITNILKNINNKNDINTHNEENEKRAFNYDEVINIFRSLCEKEIVGLYGLNELEQMYLAILGCKPLSKNKNKKQIIDSIKNYIYRIDRANAFRT